MSLSVLQSGGVTRDDGSTYSVTTGSNVTAGSRIIICAAKWIQNSTDPFVAGDCTKSAGTATLGTIALDEAREYNHFGTDNISVGVWSAEVTGGGSLTMLLASGGNTPYFVLGYVELASGNGLPTKDQSVDADGASGAPDTGSLTPPSADAIFIGALVTSVSSSTTHTPDGAFTQVYEEEDGSLHQTGSFIYRIVTSAVADSASWSAPTTAPWCAALVTYIEPAGSDGGLTTFAAARATLPGPVLRRVTRAPHLPQSAFPFAATNPAAPSVPIIRADAARVMPEPDVVVQFQALGEPILPEPTPDRVDWAPLVMGRRGAGLRLPGAVGPVEPITAAPATPSVAGWGGRAPDRVDRRVGRVAGTGLLDPLPRGTVLLEWRGIDRPPVLRLERGDRGGGMTAPIRIADVTLSVVARAWAGSHPDQVWAARRAQPIPGVWAPFTPSAATVPDLVDQAQAPILRRPGPSAAILARGIVGAAGFDLSATTRPGFGGQAVVGWTVIQYTALVGSLFVGVVPTVPGPTAARVIQALRGIAEGFTAPVAPVAAAPPVPDRAWAGSYPDRLDRRQLHPAARPALQFDPLPIPPPPAPDLPFAGPATPARRVPANPSLRALITLPVLPVNLLPIPLGRGVTYTGLIYADSLFQYQSWAGPIKPLVDPVAPTAPFTLFPGTSLPTLRRVPARLGGVVAPFRVADVTATTPDLSWAGEQPAWIARRRPTTTGLVALSWAATIPFLDPSRFDWRGTAPAWLPRRRAQATVAGTLETPVQYPIPETSWRGLSADLVWGPRRIRGLGETIWEPNARPNDPSPDLAWGPTYPDRVPAAARVRDRVWHVQAPRMIPYVPDLVGGLVSAPDWIARRQVPAAAHRVWADRFDIVIPDLRRDWSPSYPDQLTRPARREQPAVLVLPEADRAVSPLDWYTNEQDHRILAARRVEPRPVLLVVPGGALIVVSEYGWTPILPEAGVARYPTVAAPILVLTPPIASGGLYCVEIYPVAVTSPALLAATLTTPGLLDGQLTTGTALEGAIC